VDALIYEEREVEEEAEEPKEELEIGLESLADKFGLDKIVDAVARLSSKE
jgi:benzoyl-CoA reductase subunit BamC